MLYSALTIFVLSLHQVFFLSTVNGEELGDKQHLDACRLALAEANVNSDSWLDLTEYMLFVPLYEPSKNCFLESLDVSASSTSNAGAILDVLVEAAFNTLACNCSSQNCCLGDSAKVNLSRIYGTSDNGITQQTENQQVEEQTALHSLSTFCAIAASAIESACPPRKSASPPFVVAVDPDDLPEIEAIFPNPGSTLPYENRRVTITYELAIYQYLQSRQQVSEGISGTQQLPNLNDLRSKSAPFLVSSLDQLAVEIGFTLFSAVSSTRILLPTFIHGFQAASDATVLSDVAAGSTIANNSVSDEEIVSTSPIGECSSLQSVINNTAGSRLYCQFVSVSILLLNVTESESVAFQEALLEAIIDGKFEVILRQWFPTISAWNQNYDGNRNVTKSSRAELGLEIIGVAPEGLVPFPRPTPDPTQLPTGPPGSVGPPSHSPGHPDHGKQKKGSVGLIVGSIIGVSICVAVCYFGYKVASRRGIFDKDPGETCTDKQETNDGSTGKVADKIIPDDQGTDGDVEANFEAKSNSPVQSDNGPTEKLVAIQYSSSFSDSTPDHIGSDKGVVRNLLHEMAPESEVPVAALEEGFEAIACSTDGSTNHEGNAGQHEPLGEMIPQSDIVENDMDDDSNSDPLRSFDDMEFEPDVDREHSPSENMFYDGVDYGEDDVPLAPIPVGVVDPKYVAKPVYHGVDYGDDDDYYMFDGNGGEAHDDIEVEDSVDRRGSDGHPSDEDEDKLQTGEEGDTQENDDAEDVHDWAVRNRMDAIIEE